MVGATLGHRARAGRKAGRYTSRPGNSGDASSSSAFPGWFRLERAQAAVGTGSSANWVRYSSA